MSEALDLLRAGLVELDSQFAVPFTVDGIAGTKSGRTEGISVGNVLTDQGIVSRRAGRLTCPRDVWTPVIGQKVSVRGFTFVVDDVHHEELFYTAVLIESHV